MIFADIETYSELDVTDVGAYAYAQHPSTEVLLLCYAIDDGPVQCVEHPRAMSDVFTDDDLCAHNCGFEYNVLDAVLGFETTPEDWHDTAVLARTCGLPGKLETVCKVLNIEEGKAKSNGSRLIQLFCKPAPRNHKLRRYTKAEKPAEWQQFIDYCKQDVIACRELWNTLPKHTYNRERANWIIDQRINARGLPVDDLFITAALSLVTDQLAEADRRIAEVTGGYVPTVNAVAKLAEFCGVKSVDRDSTTKALARSDLSPAQREALHLRQEAGKSSTAKFVRAQSSAVGGRVRDALMFYGAQRTGRESGQQVQPQNMKRPDMKPAQLETARFTVMNGTTDLFYESPIAVASSLVRTMIAPPPGRKLVVSDLANIEGRMLAWLAGEEWKLDAFRAYDAGTGPDLYRLTYARSFGIRVEDVTPDQRQIGKVEELALGYQGGPGAFESMAAAYGVSLSLDTVLVIVKAWRRAHPRIVKFWYAVEDTAKAAIQNPKRTYTVNGVKFGVYTRGRYTWLVIVLPSGRALFYFEPRVTLEGIEYTGQIIGQTWGRLLTYGGKLVENITQACARDVLFEGIAVADAAGFEIVLHAHDEIVAECPDTDDWTVGQLGACLTAPAAWREGLPLAAAGYESTFYRKD